MTEVSAKTYTQQSFDDKPALHVLFDREAARYPDRTYLLYTEDDEPANIIHITHRELNRASHRVAVAFSQVPDYQPSTREHVALLALSDSLVYAALFYGVVRAGMVPVLISPRLAPAAVANLIQRTSCTRIIATHNLDSLVTGVLLELQSEDSTKTQIRVDYPPRLEDIFPHLGFETEEDPFQPFAIRPAEAGVDDVYLYMHSSGSTGMPKIVPQSRRAITGWCSRVNYGVWSALSPPVRVAVMPLPIFHLIGFLTVIMGPIASDASIAIYPPRVKSPEGVPYPPSASSFISHSKRAQCNQILAPPSIIHEWAHSQEHVLYLKSLRRVMFTGAPLVPKIGNSLWEQGVPLVCVHGATETGVLSTLEDISKTMKDGWMYQRPDPDIQIRWVDHGNGAFEPHFLICADQPPSVVNMSSSEGYAMSDLLVPHPDDPSLWKILGRMDSVIVLANGEKVVPDLMEWIIASHPSIFGVVMFGQARTAVGILVEPRPGTLEDFSHESLEKFKDTLWPTIVEANTQAPAFGRIFKEMIIIATANKPLPRTAKATVMVKAALRMYETEIDALYSQSSGLVFTTNAVQGSQPSNRAPPILTDAVEVERWILHEAEELLPGKRIDPNGDIFHQGLIATMLQVRTSQMLVNAGERDAASLLGIELLYSQPTIHKLAAAISAFLPGSASTKNDTTSSSLSNAELIDQAIAEYSAGLPGMSTPSVTSNSSDLLEASVLLTGSTGNLGTHLLALLLENPKVVRVYAHNRPSSSGTSIIDRQRASFADHGLDQDLLRSEKLIFLEGDLGGSQLGLSDESFADLLSNVNVVIHNAWQSNFNLTLQSFAPFIRGSRSLIDFARSCKSSANLRFVFTSSVASIQSWKNSGPVPEAPIFEPTVAVGNGYGESKYVVEMLLQRSGLVSSSFRITQLCGGGTNGHWAIDEWVPALVRSSISLGVMPSSQAPVHWIRMSDAARVIIDHALDTDLSEAAVYNLENPRSVAWDLVASHLNEALVQHGIIKSALPSISFEEWTSRLTKVGLEAGANQEKLIQEMPALKILPFFKAISELSNTDGLRLGGQPALQLEKLLQTNSALSGMEAIASEDVEQWVKYWFACSFLKTVG